MQHKLEIFTYHIHHITFKKRILKNFDYQIDGSTFVAIEFGCPTISHTILHVIEEKTLKMQTTSS